MKRVVAITVMMVMVTTLFAFSVYADTPVQPLQVVTYSDTTTNVRISGTAERLHYNVDSFQVVFMNPPNNYGTACTPILVSFRFYNSSELPAYVGQAEFELTATTGTGAVNTIIYGYDQISTDLFVAESSYSTAEVGRIGIGASNDFAYYTGFVIPPKTSLYFSCIVYVNASAYGQNNTGASEDVNQVTLSSLNLYSNQLSFSADYPYHNQPVDFSEIISAIEDLNESVSDSNSGALYQLIQNFMNNATYSGNAYQYTSSNIVATWQSQNYPNTENFLSSFNMRRIIGKPYLLNVDVQNNTVNDTNTVNGSVRYPFMVKISVNARDNISVYYETQLTNLFPSGYIINIDYFYSEIYSGITIENANTVLPFKNRIGTKSVLPLGWYSTYIIGHIDVPIGETLTFVNTNISSAIISPQVTDLYAPINEYTILRDLYYSLVKKDSDDNTEEAQDMNDEIHDKEQVWYDNNSDALEAVGLSNYRFSQSQSAGITQAVTQFQAVWNALGQWTNVYIFILILSISTYIIRHEPTTRVKQYRSSVQAERAERISYYGRKNAESRASASSGSTLKNVIRRRK